MSARHDSRPYGGALSGSDVWIVIQAKRYKERAVEGNLRRQGIATYLPLLRQWPRPAVGADVVPMFPGYLFSQPSPDQFAAVGRSIGVLRVVAFGDGPATVGPEVIAYLRARGGADGVISPDGVVAGREVTITDGPLRGLPAVIERRLTGRQRVLVLLELLQRRTRVELPDRWLRFA